MRLSRIVSAACVAAILLCAPLSAAPATAADTVADPHRRHHRHEPVSTRRSRAKERSRPPKWRSKISAAKSLAGQIVVDTVDHQNSGPTAEAKAREEFDNGAELALDMTNSAAALAVASVAKDKHKLAIVTGARHVGADRRELQQIHLSLCLRYVRAGALPKASRSRKPA